MYQCSPNNNPSQPTYNQSNQGYNRNNNQNNMNNQQYRMNYDQQRQQYNLKIGNTNQAMRGYNQMNFDDIPEIDETISFKQSFNENSSLKGNENNDIVLNV